jgi:ubiquinone biosynthesis protein UbiJ
VNDDFEEALSRVVGDIAAHRIAGGLASAAAWQRDAATRLAENVVEYLTEENPVLVPRRDLLALRDDTDALRADLDRIEKRLDQLQKNEETHR